MAVSAQLDSAAVARLGDCLERGGVGIFPSDTVYGLCCDPENEQAARRLYALKGRPKARASAVMFFSLEPALAALGELHERERRALAALLPGPVTLLVANRDGRFAAACRSDPATLGLRVPALPERLQALCALPQPVMQSSANLSGEPDARRVEDVPASIREGAEVVLDAGELPGVASTVIDLRDLAAEGRWHVLREGALPRESVHRALDAIT
jgi:L-threonylcarbamoyladenylate synthase